MKTQVSKNWISICIGMGFCYSTHHSLLRNFKTNKVRIDTINFISQFILLKVALGFKLHFH